MPGIIFTHFKEYIPPVSKVDFLNNGLCNESAITNNTTFDVLQHFIYLFYLVIMTVRDYILWISFVPHSTM